MSFANLGLSESLLRAIAGLGHKAPTPIQLKAIPLVMAGHDLLAGAQTGTGKTAAFALPMLERLQVRGAPGCAPRALVMTPTRELAVQVAASIGSYGRYLSVQTEAVYGGVGIGNQFKALRRGVDVLVATPGRLLDHVEQRSVTLSKVEILVLDEADRMLDMGFLPSIRRVLALLPANRQNLLFSATFSPEVRQLAATLLKQPEVIDVAPRNSAAVLVDQHVYHVDRDQKSALLVHLLRSGDWRQTLVFARTKHGADRLAEKLDRDGILVTAIHGNKSQGARTKALTGFKQGKVRVLVATDVAARGIDVEQISHVVNFDLPDAPEDYIHRIGRTGRAGASGEAVSLVSSDERKQLQDIQRLLGRTLRVSVAEGFKSTPRAQHTAGTHAGRRRNGQPQSQHKQQAHRRGNKSGGCAQGRKPSRRTP
jgi:ATP-dependent RNA helicase RhlE